MAASQQNTTQCQYGEESASDSDHDHSDDDKLRPVHLSSYPTPRDCSPFSSISPPSHHHHDRRDSSSSPSDAAVHRPGSSASIPGPNPLSYCKSLSFSYSHPDPECESAPNGLAAAPSLIARSQSALYPAPSQSVASPELREWLSRYSLDSLYPDLIENGYDCLLVPHCIHSVDCTLDRSASE